MSIQAEIYEIADELRAIASLGLQFAKDSYDKERSGKVMALSARLLASVKGGEIMYHLGGRALRCGV